MGVVVLVMGAPAVLLEELWQEGEASLQVCGGGSLEGTRKQGLEEKGEVLRWFLWRLGE